MNKDTVVAHSIVVRTSPLYGLYDTEKEKYVISPGTYDWLSGIDESTRLIRVIHVVDGQKLYGVVNLRGEFVVPLEYTNIWRISGSNRDSIRAEKGDVEVKIKLIDLVDDDTPFAIKDASTPSQSHTQSYSHYTREDDSYSGGYSSYSSDISDPLDAFEGDENLYNEWLMG